MSKLFANIVVLSFLSVATLMAGNQIGEWHIYQAYTDYTEAETVQPEELYFAIASNHLCRYDAATGDWQTYSRASGLSGYEVAHIAWCQDAQRLVVVYDDGNIDLLSLDDSVVNMPDLVNKSINEDKQVTGTCVSGPMAYLTVSFGVIQIDVANAVFVDTHPNGSEVQIWASLQPQKRTDFSAFSDLTDGAHPVYNQFYHGVFADDRFLSVRGAFNAGRRYDWNLSGEVQILELSSDQWTLADGSFRDTLSHACVDYNVIDVDPLDNSHYSVGAKSGLYEYRADTLFRHYTYYNSPIASPINNNKYCIIEGLKYDGQGNLWVANWQADKTILFRLDTDGNWHTTSVLGDVAYRGMRDMFIDSRDLMWMVNEDWNDQAVFCYDYKNDQYQKFSSLYNQNEALLGGTQNTILRCIAEDLDGNVWVGTQFGPVYIEPSQIYSGDQTLHQHIIARNDGSGLGDYMLSGVDVTTICVDGAGRKWFGTNGSGVYLMSRDNNTQLEHFTSDNSYLPSDVINQITIDPATGCVYFLTDQGMVSYQSEITPGADSFDEIYCYPNPVRKDFNRLLTICNLCEGSTVTITDAMRQPLFKTKTLSGTLTWRPENMRGQRLKPGVYYIFQTSADGKDGGSCKFMVL